MVDQVLAILPDVYRYALHVCRDRHHAEDLAQEVAVKALAHQADLRDSKKLRVWMYRVVENAWRDWLRRDGNRQQPIQQPDLVEDFRISSNMESHEELSRSLAALDRLPNQQRKVLRLVAVDEMSIEETAEILDISAGAVRSSLSIARQRMRKMVYGVDASLGDPT